MVNSTLEEKLERSLCSLKFMEYCFRLFVQWLSLCKWISFLLLLKLNITNFVASKNTNLLSHISESQKSETSFMGQNQASAGLCSFWRLLERSCLLAFFSFWRLFAFLGSLPLFHLQCVPVQHLLLSSHLLWLWPACFPLLRTLVIRRWTC